VKGAGVAAEAKVRTLRSADFNDVVSIDTQHTGKGNPIYWERVFRAFLHPRRGEFRVALAAEDEGRVSGYLIGEVRAFEFGSEPCGWIFAVGVRRTHLRGGVATLLLEEACRRFREHGIETIRTMVERRDVPVLAFFRANGFTAGRFVQLERAVGEER
jgi:GNAT superfamily N-acetyltransferase